MKKIVVLVVVVFLVLAFGTSLYGCDTGGEVVINENTFVMRINDIRMNMDHYLGRTIRYEGVFQAYGQDEETGEIYYRVVRQGFDAAGCCVVPVGFSVVWEDSNEEYPDDDEWVEVVGVLGTVTRGGTVFLVIELESLIVLEERGNEIVRR